MWNSINSQYSTITWPEECHSPQRATAHHIDFWKSQSGSGWEGPQWFNWSNVPAQAGSPQSAGHRIVSRWFVNILSEGDSTASLGNLFQCMVTSTLKKFFIFRGNFCALVAAYSLLSCCLAPPRRAWILLLDTYFWVLTDTDKIKPQVIVA